MGLCCGAHDPKPPGHLQEACNTISSFMSLLGYWRKEESIVGKMLILKCLLKNLVHAETCGNFGTALKDQTLGY